MNKKFGLISNICYSIKNIWQWDKKFYLYFIPSIPFNIFLPLASIYLPKFVIDAVNNKKSIFFIIQNIILYFLVIFIIDIINQFCGAQLGMRQYNVSIMYQHAITEKFMRTDFSNTDNPDSNLKYSHAMNDACSGQCSPEFIWYSLLALLTNILGIFTYGSIIAYLSPLILFLLFLSALITYFISRYQRNYIERNKDKWTFLDRKISYLLSFSENFEYAKDIRIYGMLGWINEMLIGFQKKRFYWNKKISFHSFFGTCGSSLLSMLRDGIAYAVLINRLLVGSISVGDFAFFWGAITGFSAWLNGIAGQINDVVGKSIKIG